jgi:hypothetical protein
MDCYSKPALTFQAIWVCISAIGASFVFVTLFVGAAWSEDNSFKGDAFLLIALCGALGLLIGIPSTFSDRPVYAKTTGLCALLVACLTSYLVALGVFVGPPFTSIRMFGFNAPILLLCALVLLVNIVQISVSVAKLRQLKYLR